MADAKTTYAFAATVADGLASSGLREVCVAPGSRSAPLAVAFARHPGLRVLMHVDERSAAFFALGLAKTAGRPVGLLCTSGTAAAEFHPAVIEADLSRTPLVVLTADRPPELRQVGANQAIDQARLYGGAVRWCFDPGPPDREPGAERRWRRLAARAAAEALGPPAGPVHLNLPLREPLLPEFGPAPPAAAEGPPLLVADGRAGPDPATVELVLEALRAARRPLIVAGEMRDGARLRRPLDRLLARLGAPLFAEPSSQLRRRGAPGLVTAYDALCRDAAWAASRAPDLVVRLGAPPTSKALGGWLAETAPRTLVVDPDGGWRDPEQAAAGFLRCDPERLLAAAAAGLGAAPTRIEEGWGGAWEAASARAEAAIGDALSSLPLFEAHAVRALARALPERANVFVGSSMPIRDVDSFWPAAAAGQRFRGNRGASGIDGLVSGGLGMAAGDPATPAVTLLGDLSLYHDMNGLWAIRRHRLRNVLVVLDNDGGGIFEFLPPAAHRDVFEEVFATPLGLRLEDVARLYGLGFVSVDGAAGLDRALPAALAGEGSMVVAVRFTRAASVAGHRACWGAVAEALSQPGLRAGPAA